MINGEIPGYDSFVKIEPIDKGLSSDKKFYIETADGKRLFLRVSNISEHDWKKADYAMAEEIYKIGLPTAKPFGFLSRGTFLDRKKLIAKKIIIILYLVNRSMII